MNKTKDGWYTPLAAQFQGIDEPMPLARFAAIEAVLHLLALNEPATDPAKAYLLFTQYQLIGTTACTTMEHTLQQARHTLGYYRSQKYWQDDLRAYQAPKYDAVRAFSFEQSGESRSFSKAEGEYPCPYEQRQREWERFWTERLEEAKPTSYAGAGTYRYPYLNLETGETETVSVRFDSDCTAPVPPGIPEKGRREPISVTLDELLNTAKEMHFDRILCAFQPHTYTRTKALFHEFVEALKMCDQAVLAPIYAAREKNTIGIYSSDIAREVPGAVSFDSFDEIADYLRKEAGPNDLVLTMGAGNINEVGPMLIKNK